jgi:hypothetical protein
MTWDGEDFTLDSLGSYEIFNKLKNHFYGSFPANPVAGEIAIVNNLIYYYDGTNWIPVAGIMKFFAYSQSVQDAGTFQLPAVTNSGWGFISAGNNEEYAIFFVSGDGNVTLISNSTNVVANSDTALKLCIGTAASQDPLTIKNNLGAAKQINLTFWYD